MSTRSSPQGLEATFLANRERLLRFLRARGAGDAAEDLLQDIWLKVSGGRTGPVTAPLPYLFRAADLIMIDHYRSRQQRIKRERDWSDTVGPSRPGGADFPSAERVLMGREHSLMIAAALEALGPRAATAFRRHRIDGVPQRTVADELGVSLSTVESDLRQAYKAVLAVKERIDEA